MKRNIAIIAVCICPALTLAQWFDPVSTESEDPSFGPLGRGSVTLQYNYFLYNPRFNSFTSETQEGSLLVSAQTRFTKRIGMGFWYARGNNSLKKETSAEQRNGRLFFVGIATNDYVEFSPLKWAEQDALSLSLKFREQQDSFFTQVHPYLLLNEKATTNEIYKTFKEIDGQTIQPEDWLIVFIGAHGFMTDDGTDFFIGLKESTRDNLFSSLAFTVLRHQIPKGSKVLLLLDTCHSGAAGNYASQPAKTDFAEPFFVYSACESGKQSFESDEWQGGAFTVSLIEAIDELKKKSDDGINLSTLSNEVDRKIKGRTERQGGQYPILHPLSKFSPNRYFLLVSVRN